MSQVKEIYWVCRVMTADVQQKLGLLQKYHISVRLVSDFQSLLKSYAESRLNTIIIGDEGDTAQLENAMMRLCNHPEYAGVRFVLSLSRSLATTVNRAVDLGFRDIIPVDLPDSQWLRRYAFASSGRPTELSPPHPQMSMQNLASVQIPGRVAWITEKELWLETRLAPPVGSELSLSGGLAELLGLKQVRLKVMTRYRSHLHFRYSEALLCRWEVAPSHQVRKLAVQNFIDEQGSLAHYRLYAIVKNRELRNLLVRKLPTDRFQLTVALNKNNMIQEPRFISPDAILIEDKMCLGPHLLNFEEMLRNLDPQVPVFVLGDSAKMVVPQTEHRIIPLTSLMGDFKDYFESALGAPKAVNLDATPIPKNHELSFANILLPARITSVHSDFVEIASAYPLGRFGLLGIESPVFQSAVAQRVHGKVLDSIEGDHSGQLKEFPYRSRAIIVDLAKPEREKLSRHIVELFCQQMLPKGWEFQAGPWKALAQAGSPIAPHDQSNDPIRTLTANGPDINPTQSFGGMPEVQGAGPMRTELSKSLKDIGPEPSPATSMETEVRPLAEQILIERNYRESHVASYFQILRETVSDIPREWKIAMLVALVIGLALWGGFYLRMPLESQAPEMTEQLKLYQEQHGGKRPLPPAQPRESFDP